MYRTYWRLERPPFRSGLDPAGFYQSPTHEEALARLDFLVNEHRRLGLLIGEAGSGKSLVLDVFAAQLRQQGRCVATVNLTALEPVELLSQIAIGLGLNPSRGLSTAGLWRLVIDRILEFRYQRTDTVLLLDDADCATGDVLAHVTRLAKTDPGAESRLTIVLAGQPSRIGRLGTTLLELAELRIDLEAWELSDTARFIETSLHKAGRTSPAFAEPAIARLQQLSRGIPRRVSRLADLALVAGAGRKLDWIDADTVESASRELAAMEANDEGGMMKDE